MRRFLGAFERTSVRVYGWATHVDTQGPVPFAFTQGLMERFEHPDLQAVLEESPEALRERLARVAFMVAGGRVFRADEEADLDGQQVRFRARTFRGREYLRVVFADHEGRFPDEPDCNPHYRIQLVGVRGEGEP